MVEALHEGRMKPGVVFKPKGMQKEAVMTEMGFPRLQEAAVTHVCPTGTESSAFKRHLQRQWHENAKQRGRGKEKKKPGSGTKSLAHSTRRRTLLQLLRDMNGLEPMIL